jgi:hypothetical protein
MDVLPVEPLARHGLHGLGLGDLLGGEPVALAHVEEVGVAAGVELVGPVEPHAALGEEVREHPVTMSRPPAP